MRLLVSAKNATEVESLLRSDVPFIDLKDPSAGPLGAVCESIQREVIQLVRDLGKKPKTGKKPKISVACGEWTDQGAKVAQGVDLAKLGSAGFLDRPDRWAESWREWQQSLPAGCQAVMVAYADWETSRALNPKTAIEKAEQFACQYVLVDTFDKTAAGLLGLATKDEILNWKDLAQSKGLTMVLAGKLSLKDVRELRGWKVEVAGVRSAVCREGRESGMDPEKLQELIQIASCECRI